MSEWSNVPVLKTGEGNTSGGSNPPLPATYSTIYFILFLQLHLKHRLFLYYFKIRTKLNALLYTATGS